MKSLNLIFILVLLVGCTTRVILQPVPFPKPEKPVDQSIRRAEFARVAVKRQVAARPGASIPKLAASSSVSSTSATFATATGTAVAPTNTTMVYNGHPVALVNNGQHTVVIWWATVTDYSVQSSRDLTNWVTLFSAHSDDTNSPQVLMDYNASTFPTKFYRLVPATQ